MKTRKILMVISFFTIIIVGAAFTNFKEDAISEIDNKNLLTFENNSNIHEKLKSSEEYLSDRIGFRNEFVSMYMNLNNGLFNTIKHPLYEYGLNDELFYRFSENEYNKEFVEDFFNFLLNLQNFYKERNIDFLFVLEPSKNEIYEEYVPKHVNISDYNYEKLIELIENSELNYLNNYDVFIEGKKNGRVYSKKSDVGHWTDYGASLGINNIINRLQNMGFNLNSIDENNYKKETIVDKYIPSSNLIINEKITKYQLKDKHFVNFFDEKIKDTNNPIVNYNMKIWNEISINEQHPYFDIMENDFVDNDYNLLLFRGSYFTGKEKFIGELFNNITAVHNYENLLEAEYFTNIAKPDIVILELAQGTIKPDYFDPDILSKKEFSKVYLPSENPILELDGNLININTDIKDVLIDLNIDINGIFDSAYIKLDELVYDINLNKDYGNKKSSIFTSILEDDLGNNNELILIKDGTDYIFNLNNFLIK